MNTRFHAGARADFDSAVDFYEREAPGLGDELIREVEQALHKLGTNPQIGLSYDGDARRILLVAVPT